MTTQETLDLLIPALEFASGCTARELRKTCPQTELTPDEWAALWMARAILEGHGRTQPKKLTRKQWTESPTQR